eukprot:CAMPEP_0119038026 /NCGR_PEP_ID=MMETSP1177-20130426/6674_1 /TAXON_ID=2985 /ORGANISM="Ochromonas sp, Strain CCMP1899" /LENGTH=328 /DNA_ID=CAMNT_0007000035 /DNA_START=56 /DNA_END=1039 /DNA_ORIENTATION=-
MKIRARNEDCSSLFDVEYDPNDGLDVLNYQLLSIFPDATQEFLLFDFAGRPISTQEDIDDISNTFQLESPINNEIQAIDTLSVDSSSTTNITDNRIADIWCASDVYINTENFCTRKMLSVIKSDDEYDNNNDAGDVKINSTNDNDTPSGLNGNEGFDEFIQPAYHIIDTTIRLCHRCQKLFDKSLIVHDTSELLSFVCQSNQAIDMGLAYAYAEESLKSEKFKYYNPISLYMKRVLYSQAVELISDSVREGGKERAFEGRIIQGCKTVDVYEDEAQQAFARGVIDYEIIIKYANEYLEENKEVDIYVYNPDITFDNNDVAYLMGLLRW